VTFQKDLVRAGENVPFVRVVQTYLTIRHCPLDWIDYLQILAFVMIYRHSCGG